MVALPVERSPTKARDPLSVAESKAYDLTRIILEWELHLQDSPAHDTKKCPECLRYFKESRDLNVTIGFRLVDGYHRPVRVCAREGCGNEFNPGTDQQRYCSHRCRQAAYLRRKSGKGDLHDQS